MVRRVHHVFGGAEHLGDAGSRGKSRSVVLEGAGKIAVLEIADDVGQVLVQRATFGHTHDLESAADAEHRNPAVVRAEMTEDVREVANGFECGILLKNFNDVKEGDVIEAYTINEVERDITSEL